MPIKINSKRKIHQGRVFTMYTENVTLDNDVTVDLDVIKHPGASAIVPFTKNNTVVMIKQYRHAVKDYIWEIPAGTLDPNEEPLSCARRELVEETGFSARTWEKLGEIITVPGYSDEKIHIYLAEDLSPAEQNLDHDEVLDVHELRFDDCMGMIYTGKIQDGKTISGLFFADAVLKKRT